MWNEGVVQELAQLKKRMGNRNTRLKKDLAAAAEVSISGNDGGSLASSMESSLGSRGRVGSGGNGIGVGKKQNGAVGGGGGGGGGKGNNRSTGGTFPVEPRSRFSVSLVIPCPKQHDGLVVADLGDSSGGGGTGGEGRNNNTNSAETNASSKSNRSLGSNNAGSASASTSASPSAPAPASASAVVGAWNSKLRLDIVRADAERSAGSPRSPRPGAEAGGGLAAATARFDSAARELLQGYEDEQVP